MHGKGLGSLALKIFSFTSNGADPSWEGSNVPEETVTVVPQHPTSFLPSYTLASGQVTSSAAGTMRTLKNEGAHQFH